MLSLREDIRYALRLLGRSPGFAAVAILLLALGVGSTTAIFSVVDSVLLKPLPYREPERLAFVWMKNAEGSRPQSALSAPESVEFGRAATGLEGMTARFYYSATVTGGGQPARVMTVLVGCNYFELLGLRVALGRGFIPSECEAGRNQVTVLTDGFWKQRFGGDPTVVGRTMVVDHEVHTIAGVLAPVPYETASLDLYIPLALTPALLEARDARYLTVLARLRPGITLQRATEELKSLSARLAAEHPGSNAGWNAYLTPAPIQAQGEARQPLAVLSVTVGLVLVIACANLANLLLVRATGRSREVAIRGAMGASQWRVFRQMMTESAVLALAGGAAGLLLAHGMVRGIIAWSPASLPRISEARIDVSALVFAVLASLAAGVLSGTAPAARVLRLNLAVTLRDESRGGTPGIVQRWLRSLLVVSEVAMAAILLIGAGLLTRTILSLTRIDMGFRPENVLTLRTTMADAKYNEPSARATYVRRVLERIHAVPGVRAAGVATALPMMQVNWLAEFFVDGSPDTYRDAASYNAISPRYLEAVGARLMKGRIFTDADNENSAKVVLISQAFEKRYFPGRDPIGQTLHIRVSKHEFTAQVVGVVADMAHLRPEEPPRVALYQPHAQLPWHFLAFAVRTAGPPAAATPAVRQAFFEIDPELPVDRVQPMTGLLERVLAQQRLAMGLLLVFSVLSVLLALVGLYGVLSVSVEQRRREIGIRMALGSQSAGVLRLVLLRGLSLTGAGLAAGLATAPLFTRVFQQMLYGVTPLDPLTFAAAGLLIAMAALLASLIPAWRAARVDPAVALRQE